MKKRTRRPEPPIVDLEQDARAWLKVEPLAAYWRVQEQTLRKWIRQGILPAKRFGRAWRVRTVDARTFEDRNPVRGAA